jgi:hypothetical protein
LTQQFAVSDVLVVATGEGEPGGEFGVRRKRLANGFSLGQRWECFEGEKVWRLQRRCGGEDTDAVAMELTEVFESADVIAVIFRAVVEGCAIGSERCGNKDAAIWV